MGKVFEFVPRNWQSRATVGEQSGVTVGEGLGWPSPTGTPILSVLRPPEALINCDSRPRLDNRTNAKEGAAQGGCRTTSP